MQECTFSVNLFSISSLICPETTESNVIITAVVMIVLFISSARTQVEFQLKDFVGENIPLVVEEMTSSLQSAAAFIASESQG